MRAKENEVAEMLKLSRMAEEENEKRKNKENLSIFTFKIIFIFLINLINSNFP